MRPLPLAARRALRAHPLVEAKLTLWWMTAERGLVAAGHTPPYAMPRDAYVARWRALLERGTWYEC